MGLGQILAAGMGPLQAFYDSDFCGKLIVIVQIVMSVWSWAVMLRRVMQLRDYEQRSNQFVDDFAKQNDPLTLHCARYIFSDSPMERVYERTSERLVGLIPAEQMRALQLNVRAPICLRPALMELVETSCAHATDEETLRLSEGMTALAVITNSAPLFGLFGTVWGVMLAFQAMAASGSANITELAPGISSALLTTVVGLLVAIPSTIAYNALQRRIERYTVQLEGFSEELMGKLSLNYGDQEKGHGC